MHKGHIKLNDNADNISAVAYHGRHRLSCIDRDIFQNLSLQEDLDDVNYLKLIPSLSETNVMKQELSNIVTEMEVLLLERDRLLHIMKAGQENYSSDDNSITVTATANSAQNSSKRNRQKNGTCNGKYDFHTTASTTTTTSITFSNIDDDEYSLESVYHTAPFLNWNDFILSINGNNTINKNLHITSNASKNDLKWTEKEGDQFIAKFNDEEISISFRQLTTDRKPDHNASYYKNNSSTYYNNAVKEEKEQQNLSSVGYVDYITLTKFDDNTSTIVIDSNDSDNDGCGFFFSQKSRCNHSFSRKKIFGSDEMKQDQQQHDQQPPILLPSILFHKGDCNGNNDSDMINATRRTREIPKPIIDRISKHVMKTELEMIVLPSLPNSPNKFGYSTNISRSLDNTINTNQNGHTTTAQWRQEQQQKRLRELDTNRIKYLSTGPCGQYYIQFNCGLCWWRVVSQNIQDDAYHQPKKDNQDDSENNIDKKNNNHVDLHEMLQILSPNHIRRVVFGDCTSSNNNEFAIKCYPWVIVMNDGHCIWKGLPKKLHNLLWNQYQPQMQQQCTANAVAELSLGYGGSWFARFVKDDYTEYCLPLEIAKEYEKLVENNDNVDGQGQHVVTNVILNSNCHDCYIIRYYRTHNK